ncbi:MAG: D-alanyl-D-alanine carboxypeptidase/D-alanyl-D-alanine-endopeptidase [Cyanobacteria bacterium]|nr:D-alanyl-D-alanine carboxypeptidase/D-alanyl-D-alanine-endopeptidase [Cyanobacteriota bacterium]
MPCLLSTAPALALCPADLSARVEAIADRPELNHARLGVQVETLTGEGVYSRQGDRFFLPASNMKLFSTAAVLTALGPDYRIPTRVYGSPNGAGLTTLRVVGQGDPSFDSADLAALAQPLYQQGVRQVDPLIGDESAFAGDPVHPNWEWEDVQAGYGAPVNSLILNGNALGLTLFPQTIGQPLRVQWDQPALAAHWQVENQSITVAPGEAEFVTVGRHLGSPILRVSGQLMAGSEPETAEIAVSNPGESFLTAFRAVLLEQGIAVDDVALTATPLSTSETPWASVMSPALAELLIPANQASNNLYAEALLKQLGLFASDGQDATTAALNRAAPILASLGVDLDEVVIVDGSGLSRHNLATPQALVDVLQGMAASPYGDIYRDSLAVAGESGTLRNRFRDTPMEGQFWGKSGAVSRNFALSGYLAPPNHEPLAVSVLINNIDQPGRVARQLIDEVMGEIAALSPCDRP